MKNKKGISLIALIITIIVIIILAAIVIGGVFNTPSQAAFARFCNDMGEVQQAVNISRYSRMSAEGVKTDSQVINNGNIYKWLATGDATYSTTDTTSVPGKELVKMDKNNNKLTISLPEYTNQDWYIDLNNGEVYLLPDGYIYDGKVYKTQADITGGGTVVANNSGNPTEAPTGGGEPTIVTVAEAGLFSSSSGSLIKDWETLLTEGIIHVDSNGILTTNFAFASNKKENKNLLDVFFPTVYAEESNSSASSLVGRLVIPSTVTGIGNDAFALCNGLTTVELPSSITSIGAGAFYPCEALTSIVIPGSVEYIDECAFAGCISLASVTIENGVEEIGRQAFDGCESLTSIVIPNSVVYINEGAFVGCVNLASVTLGSGVVEIADHAFDCCESLSSITIPDSVEYIGELAFGECYGLTSVTFGSGVEEIGEDAFCYCESLSSINLPSSVTSIGARAFQNCTGLTSVTINNGSAIPSGNFNYDNNDSIFLGCDNIENITINSGTINSMIFTGSNHCISSINIGADVTAIGENAFEDFRLGTYGSPKIDITINQNQGTILGAPWVSSTYEGTSSDYDIRIIWNNGNQYYKIQMMM